MVNLPGTRTVGKRKCSADGAMEPGWGPGGAGGRRRCTSCRHLSQVRLTLQPAASRRSHLHRPSSSVPVTSSRAGVCQTSVGGPVGRVTACDWKWRERISGPAEGERGLPAAARQLVSRPANPAPSARHLLHPLRVLINLSASHRSQRLCHSASVLPCCVF